MSKLDFTHTNLTILDFKKVKTEKVDFYKIMFKDVSGIITVTSVVFEPRILSHFAKDSMNYISRNDILSIKYKGNITKGYYYRVDKEQKISRFNAIPSTNYLNFFEVDSPINSIGPAYFSKYDTNFIDTDNNIFYIDKKDDLPF